MKAQALIDGGICGFHSKVRADSDDGQMVQFKITSGCEKIQALGKAVEALGPVDAYEEISPEAESRIMKTVRDSLKGCCAGCAAPVGVFKTMQVAAGLALPKDIVIHLSKLEN